MKRRTLVHFALLAGVLVTLAAGTVAVARLAPANALANAPSLQQPVPETPPSYPPELPNQSAREQYELIYSQYAAIVNWTHLEWLQVLPDLRTLDDELEELLLKSFWNNNDCVQRAFAAGVAAQSSEVNRQANCVCLSAWLAEVDGVAQWLTNRVHMKLSTFWERVRQMHRGFIADTDPIIEAEENDAFAGALLLAQHDLYVAMATVADDLETLYVQGREGNFIEPFRFQVKEYMAGLNCGPQFSAALPLATGGTC